MLSFVLFLFFCIKFFVFIVEAATILISYDDTIGKTILLWFI